MDPFNFKLRRAERKQALAAEELQTSEGIVRYLAQWRALCAEVGPWQYAAALRAPIDEDLHTVAYLAVWSDIAGATFADDDVIDEAIAMAVSGFDQYLLEHPESVRPE